jgi:hypothetical protein
MFCSFTRNSRILRQFGTGRPVRPDDAEFAILRTHFGNLHPGVRAAIVIDVERIADACGYAVPYYALVERNRHSIDGLPALNADHPLPSSIEC